MTDIWFIASSGPSSAQTGSGINLDIQGVGFLVSDGSQINSLNGGSPISINLALASNQRQWENAIVAAIEAAAAADGYSVVRIFNNFATILK